MSVLDKIKSVALGKRGQGDGVSLIVNAHREGAILIPALRTAIAARGLLRKQEISAEIILVVDSADAATDTIVEQFAQEIDRTIKVGYANLAKSREHGIRDSREQFICFLDGDDLWQPDWPLRAYQLAQQSDYLNTVYHAELFVGFGRDFFVRRQIDSDDAIFHPMNLISTWHFCNDLLAHKSIFERFPVEPYDHAKGYGSEDWHWSCETLANGVARLSVPETAYFYRLDPNKPSLGSVRGLVLKPSKLFQDLSLAQDYLDSVGDEKSFNQRSIRSLDEARVSSRCPSWLHRAVKDTAKFDYELYELLERLPSLECCTPFVPSALTFAYAAIASFLSGSEYLIFAVDCKALTRGEAGICDRHLARLTRKIKAVVFVSDVLCPNVLIRTIGNRLYVNFEMCFRSCNNNNDFPFIFFGNLVSQLRPRAIHNLNYVHLDYCFGRLSKFLSGTNLEVSRVLFSSPGDVLSGANSRAVLTGLTEGLFWYNRLLATSKEDALLVRKLLWARPVKLSHCNVDSLGGAIYEFIEGRSADLPELDDPYRGILLPSSRTKSEFTVSCLLNLHREGNLCTPTFHSIAAMMAYADKRGVSSELIVVRDDSDIETSQLTDRIVQSRMFNGRTTVVDVRHRNLALSRNEGIEASHGRFVALLDGDDLYSENWIANATMLASRGQSKEYVFHPELNVYFGRETRLFWHPDMVSHREYSYETLALANLWTSLSFASKSVYVKQPFAPIDLGNSLGYEDWHWNMETVSRGQLHVVVPSTSHFIRLKHVQSLNAASAAVGAVPRSSNFAAALLGAKKEDGQ